jgi:hypothetical protein
MTGFIVSYVLKSGAVRPGTGARESEIEKPGITGKTRLT